MGLRYNPATVLLEEARKLPADLEKTYEHCLKRIDQFPERDKTFTRTIFRWLICAKRPLRLIELHHVVAIREGITVLKEYDLIPRAESILECCCNLVKIVNDVVEFVHLSVKEYFMKGITEGSKDFILGNIVDTHQEIAIACLTYLQLKSFQVICDDGQTKDASEVAGSNSIGKDRQVDLDKLLACIANTSSGVCLLDKQYSLLWYASQHWAEHCLQAEKETSKYVKKFIQSRSLARWLEVCSIYDMQQTQFPSDALRVVLRAIEIIKHSEAFGSSESISTTDSITNVQRYFTHRKICTGVMEKKLSQFFTAKILCSSA